MLFIIMLYIDSNYAHLKTVVSSDVIHKLITTARAIARSGYTRMSVVFVCQRLLVWSLVFFQCSEVNNLFTCAGVNEQVVA